MITRRRSGSRRQNGNWKTNGRRRLSMETLEPRLALTWVGVPPTTVTPPAAATTAVTLVANDASGAATIATTEVDYYSFTATTTGSYVISATTLGLVLATVFQLAHCSDRANFRITAPGSTSVGRPWAEHQVETAVDFGRSNRLLCWYLGGLNFQVVHHLFPKVCHLHYPALAPIVEATCRAHGVEYFAFPTARAALRSHVRWLRTMGQPPGRELSPDQSQVAAAG